MVGSFDDQRGWTTDTARMFVLGAVGVFCDEGVREAGADGGAVAIFSASAKSRELVHVTDAIAERIDELQFTLGEGPCLDAYHVGRPHDVADLSAMSSVGRWPGFAREVIGIGAEAVFAFPVMGSSSPLGVFELYRRTAGPLEADQHAAALGCAASVGAVLRSAWTWLAVGFDDLTPGGLTQPENSSPLSRAEVHVAAGMVAEQLGVSVDEATDRVRAFAFASGRRITELSQDILTHRISLASQSDD